MPLTEQQSQFVWWFVRIHNGAEAARRAGYSEERAKQEAYELRRHPEVAAAIDEAKADREAEDERDHQLIRDSLRHIITADRREMFDSTGPRNPADLDYEQGLLFESFSQSSYENEGGQSGQTSAAKMTPRLKALDMLARGTGWYKDALTVTHNGEAQKAEQELDELFGEALEEVADESAPGA